MSKLSRRDFLKMAGIGLLATGCSPAIDVGLANRQPVINTNTLATASPETVHLLNRATFGATSTLVQDVQSIGMSAWLDQQFDYRTINDWELELRLRRLDSLTMTAGDLLSFVRVPDRRAVANQLAGAMLMRAIHSKRQLYEKMVHFWNDHFSIYYFKGRTSTLQTVDDREVIRPHALGNFGDMLTASAHSPAMLVYLDNEINEKSHPNENYAREIMELHTLGVDGAYTEQDVVEVARCFTGWSVGENGNFVFRPEWHDNDEKIVLGHVIPADGGKSDGDRVLEILINHPDTARYVSTKLIRRFVADEPSETMINDINTVWMQSNGDIPTIMRAIFDHDDFWQAPSKFKRPLEYGVSVLRSLNATYSGAPELVQRFDEMGQRPFGRPTPDGYPDVAEEWLGSFLPRWNFAQDVTHGWQEGVSIPIDRWTDLGREVEHLGLAQAIYQRDPTAQEIQAMETILNTTSDRNQQTVRDLLAIILSSPAFQWR